jgi:polar amino acid transport system substrate-binding protein
LAALAPWRFIVFWDQGEAGPIDQEREEGAMARRIGTLWLGLGVLAAGLGVATTAAAGVLQEIKARGKLIVGLAAVYEPFEFKQGGKIVGYDVDIIEGIAKELGVQAELVDVAFTGLLGGLEAKRFDMLLSGLAPTKERMKRVNFSIPYADASRVLVIKATTANITKMEDLSGKTVATELGSASERFTRAFEASLKAKGLPGYKAVKTYEQLAEAFLDLSIGRSDAVMDTRPHAMTMMKKKPGEYKVATPVGERRVFAAVFRKEDDDLRAAVNEILTRMRKDGRLDELQRKWFGFVFEDLPYDFTPTE